MLYLLLLIGLSITVDIAKCNLSVRPKNAAVIADQMMGIECRTPGGWIVREWTLLRVSRGENHKLQQNLKNEKIFSNWNIGTNSTHSAEFWVDVDQYGSGTLYSNSTTLEDAGLYTCVIETGQGLIRWSAHLIILESTPFCETNLSTSTGNLMIEGDRIWMRCSVGFRGYWTPSMEWRQHDGEDKDGRIIAAEEDVEDEKFSVTSTISVTFKSSTNKTFFSCKTYFSSQKHRLHANATNAPDFSYLWKSSEIIQRYSDSIFITTSKISPENMNSASKTDHTYNVLLGLLVTTSMFVMMMAIIIVMRFRKKYKSSDAVGCSTAPSTLTLGEMETSISGKRQEFIRSTGALSEGNFPVYAAVRKPRKPAEGAVGIACKIISSDTVEDKNQISEYDSDYAEIGDINGYKPKREKCHPASSMMNCQSTYASIDHTEDPSKSMVYDDIC